MPRTIKLSLPYALLALLSCASLSHAQSGDGRVRWLAMQTPHFNVYFPQGTYAFALRTARLCEEAHAALVSYALHAPKVRTHVVVLDNSDDANGAATALPRNLMYLYTAPPAARGVLNDSDDWLRGLIYHEYLHVLHLDTMSQIFRVVNQVLGRVFAPNMLMPRWWIEGWATVVETDFTGGGRGRSSLFDAYMRAAVLSKKPLSLAQITHTTVIWPRGTSAYLYGSRFLAYISRKYGKGVLAKIAHYYGNLLFPYGMNLVVKRILKKRYEELYKEWLQALHRRYSREARRVRRWPLTRARKLTTGGEWLGVPRYSKDGEFLWIYRVDGTGPDRLIRIRRKDGKIHKVLQTNSYAQFGIDRDAQVGVLSQTEAWRNIYFYKDLFRFSPRSGGLRRITFGERAKEPDVSADGKRLIYIRHRAGQTSLWARDIDGKRPRLLYRPPLHAVLSSPRFSPDGTKIVLSAWYLGGYRDILLLEPRSKGRWKVRRLTKDRAQDIEPSFSPDGKEILFASDLNGIFNLYGLRLSDGRRRRITNELYGGFAPSASPDGKRIAYARFGPSGLDLVEMAYPTQATPYPMPTRLKKWPRKRYATPQQVYPVRPYDPKATLAPLNWFPVLSADIAGQTLGLRFNGSDILGFHSYDLNLRFGIDSGEFAYDLNYRYSQLYASLSLSHGRFPRTAFGALFVNGRDTPFPERVTYGTVSVELPFTWWLASHLFFARYQLQWLEAITLTVPLRPADIPPRYPELGLVAELTFGWSFSSSLSYGRSISSEQGRNIWLQVKLQHPNLGSIGESWQVEGSWTEFIAMPWAKQHVLALSFVGGIGQTSFRVRRLFFLGGIPIQDLFQSALLGGRIGGGYLRGYLPFRFNGNARLLLQSEYRLPLFFVEQGVGVGPIFLRRLHFAFFADAGQTFQEPYDWRQFEGVKVGVGAELRLEALVAYYAAINIRFGFAKGLMEGGFDHLYLILGSSF